MSNSEANKKTEVRSEEIQEHTEKMVTSQNVELSSLLSNIKNKKDTHEILSLKTLLESQEKKEEAMQQSEKYNDIPAQKSENSDEPLIEQKQNIKKPSPTKTVESRSRSKTPSKSSNTKKNVKKPQASKVTNSVNNNDLFLKLTQKIGIKEPVISQLSDVQVSDTIMRERQLRDFMRIQITEMRDIMEAMFEQKITEKFPNASNDKDDANDSSSHALFSEEATEKILTRFEEKIEEKLEQFLEYLINNPVTPNPENINVDTDAIVNVLEEKIDGKLQNFLMRFEHLHANSSYSDDDDDSDSNDSKSYNRGVQSNISFLSNLSDDIDQKLSEKFQYLVNNIEQINLTLIDNIDNRIEDTLQRLLQNHFSESDVMSAGDRASFSSLQDSTSVLSSRMERLEDVCMELDDKLSQIQSNYNNSDSHSDASEHLESIRTIKDELEMYMKSIPEYMNNAIAKSTNKDDMRSVIDTLNSLSKRLLTLEKNIHTDAMNNKKTDEVENKTKKNFVQQDYDINQNDDNDDNNDNSSLFNIDYSSDDDDDDDNHRRSSQKNKNSIHNEPSNPMDRDWEDDSDDEPDFMQKIDNKNNDYDDSDEEDTRDPRNIDRKKFLKDVRKNVESTISKRENERNETGIVKKIFGSMMKKN